MDLDAFTEADHGDLMTVQISGRYAGIYGGKGVVMKWTIPWNGQVVDMVFPPENVTQVIPRAIETGDNVMMLLALAPGLSTTGKVAAVSADGRECAVQWPDRFGLCPLAELIRVRP